MEKLPIEYYSISSESNVKLEVSVENLEPDNGASFSPLWIGLHDGSFDTFEVGEPASSGIKNLAEDGIVGPSFNFEGLLEIGVPPENLPPEEETIESEFENSSAGKNGGIQDFIPNPDNPAGIFPGENFSTTLDIDQLSDQRFFSYASMPFPTNDGFIADEEAIELFDAEGNFIGEDIIVTGQDIWDAGTEVNDENPENVPYTPDVVGNGIEENGTVHLHPSLQPPGSGGALDFDDGLFRNANINDSDDPIFKITVNPLVIGNDENNSISGKEYREKIRGLEGNDLIYGEGGNDTVEGGQGDDYILGNEGNDYLLGNSGQDLIVGDAGDDLIDGGEGNDLLSGRSGADQFILRAGDGLDTITDYQDGIDSFFLADGLEFEQLAITITPGSGGTTISIAETNEELAVLENTSASEITALDFI